MGESKEFTESTSRQQTTVQPTAEETELNRLRLEREKALDPSILQAQQQGLDLSSLLLTGGEGGGLPGFLQGLPGGISPDVTQDIVDRALGDVRAGLQGGGLLDSGVRQELEARTSADIRTQSEQFNLQNLSQLLNLAVGGQAQPLSSIQGFGGQLSQALAGLRGQTGTGSGTSSTTSSAGFFQPGGFGSTVAGGFSGGFGQGIGTAAGAALLGCWVAAEIFGGWLKPKTCQARRFMNLKAPAWLKNIYFTHGERFAEFIKDKPVIKALLRPIFEVFAWSGGR